MVLNVMVNIRGNNVNGRKENDHNHELKEKMVMSDRLSTSSVVRA